VILEGNLDGFRDPARRDKGISPLIEVNRPQNEAELATRQTAVQRGRPFGSTIWQEITATKLGLESTFQPRGRPKKYK
jgi:hypothetical protein